MYRPTDLKDVVAKACSWTAAGAVLVLFGWITVDLVVEGFNLLSWDFLTSSPQDAGRQGGIAPILVSTSLIMIVCLGVSLPLGLATAAFLAEFVRTGHWLAAVVRRSLDILAGVPSIVFGLFGGAFFCNFLGLGFSILSGGLTLACMVLPILIRTTEEGLRAVPHSYRLNSAALGLSQTATLTHVVLPLAKPGLAAGLILGLGRAIAETAALIFTSGYVDRMPQSLLDSGRSLSIHIYDLAMNIPGGEKSAYATALVLIILVILFNSTVMTLSRPETERNLMA